MRPAALSNLADLEGIRTVPDDRPAGWCGASRTWYVLGALSMHHPCNNVFFFLPFSRMAVGGKVCLQESDELFSPCCSNTLPLLYPGAEETHLLC